MAAVRTVATVVWKSKRLDGQPRTTSARATMACRVTDRKPESRGGEGKGVSASHRAINGYRS